MRMESKETGRWKKQEEEGEPAWMSELRRRGAALGPLAHLFPFAQLASVARRNERERRRVRQINSAFASLRTRVQHLSVKRKLSKVDTLRCAIDYIQHLQGVLVGKRSAERDPFRQCSSARGNNDADDDREDPSGESPASSWSGSDLDLTWCDDVNSDSVWRQSSS